MTERRRGKRVSVRWTVLGLVGLIAVASGPPTAWGQEELFVANDDVVTLINSSITVYTRTASGNTAPLRTLSGAATGLIGPVGLVVDTVNNELVVANSRNNSITIYPRTASGNTAPLRTLSGFLTELSGPSGLVVDTMNDELIVANRFGVSVTVYPRTASGNTAPLRSLQGSTTGLSSPVGLIVDPVSNELVVGNPGNASLTIYPRTASGNTAPLRTLQGPATGLSFPEGLALDHANNELLVANGTSNSITVYTRTATGNTAPLRSLQGLATGLSSPRGLAVDLASNELLATNVSGSVTVYTRTASGNTAPLRSLSGVATGLNGPEFLAVTTSVVTDAFVTRLYQQVLSRAPEPGGIAAWVQKVQQDGAVVPTVLAFFHSAEFLSQGTSDAQFLTILFRTFLNREPDQAGLNAFLGQLQAGQLTRDNLLDIFIDSQEFADQASFLPPLSRPAEFVTTLYVRILGRGPDTAGLQSFVAPLQQVCTSATVLGTARSFLASPEYLARQTTNTEFVTLLFRVFFDRVPDPAGLASFVVLLNQGTVTRDQLVTQFAASAEFQATVQNLCS